jgi:DNA-binding NtrC family response regulator
MAQALSYPLGGVGDGGGSVASLRRLVEDYERRLIQDALERAAGNQRRAAVELGCLPTTLNEKMKRLGLRACDHAAVDRPEVD